MLALVIVLTVPASARADWSIGGYIGAAWTHPAALDIVGLQGRRTFEHVTFRSESFEAPMYYGYRVGRSLTSRALFIEAELIHLKTIANPDTLGDPFEHFAMSHGMNFLLANIVWVRPAGAIVDFVARAGIGPTLPHVEARAAGEERQGYELGGVGVQVAPGIAARLGGPWRVTAEYKFTWARPDVEVPGGTARTRIATHHLAFGLAAVF